MLRRKPTALTITSEDILSFEDTHARRLAYLRYKKTGEDPEGLFRDGNATTGTQDTNATRGNSEGSSKGNGAKDPNDELKPLPGDKARIVRGREERVMGTTVGGGHGGQGR